MQLLILPVAICGHEDGVEEAEAGEILVPTVILFAGLSLVVVLVGLIADDPYDAYAEEVDLEKVDFGDGEGPGEFGEEGGLEVVEAGMG